MRLVIIFCVAAVTLAACGADGEPLSTTYTTKTTIGYNSKTGAFNKTVFGVAIGN